MKAKIIDKSTYRLVNETDLIVNIDDEFDVVGFYQDIDLNSMVVLRKFGYIPFAIEDRELEIY